MYKEFRNKTSLLKKLTDYNVTSLKPLSSYTQPTTPVSTWRNDLRRLQEDLKTPNNDWRKRKQKKLINTGDPKYSTDSKREKTCPNHLSKSSRAIPQHMRRKGRLAY